MKDLLLNRLNWGTVDFSLYPFWALFITFFIVFGLRHARLAKPLSLVVFAVIIALLTRGIALNQNDLDLISCGMLPSNVTTVGARSSVIYKLETCNEKNIQFVDLKENWEPQLRGISHIVLRSDDALNGFLTETGRWRILSTTPATKSFVRGLGKTELKYNLLEPVAQS